jgi:hypothetical protein
METFIIKNVLVESKLPGLGAVKSKTVNTTVPPCSWEQLNTNLFDMFKGFLENFADVKFDSLVMSFEYANSETPDLIHQVDHGFDTEGDIYCC